MRPLIKIHGGKFRIKHWILSHFPSNYTSLKYYEPYVGGGSIILNKDKGQFEWINDIDTNLIDLYFLIRDKVQDTINRLQLLSYHENTFLFYRDCLYKNGIDKYVINRMSRGGLGKTFAKSNRLRGGKMGDLNAWETSIEELHKISARIQNVEIFNRPAIDFIKRADHNSFIYCDPPYLHETRTAKKCYDYEMLEQDHIDLLDVLVSSPAKVLLSGYYSKLYNRKLVDWSFYTKDVKNNSGQGKKKKDRVECLWANY